MISFAKILDSSCVANRVEARDKESALVAAVDVLAKGGKVPDRSRLLEDIRARERLASTGIGEGVAVPHALCDSLTETLLAVVHLAQPVAFGALDGQPVDLLFMMAGPKGGTTDHLKLLSKLAKLLHDGTFRQAARQATDGKALAQLLYDQD
jgi:fructose-specific phosphotransferase system IIA component